MRKLFFRASNDVIQQITDLYDFVWPTASAMWNFRWQVKGFVNEVGLDNVTQQNLLARFDWGSGIHGVNLKSAILQKTWEQQQEQFARFLLVNLIAIYEGWIDELQAVLGFSKTVATHLQFPSGIDKNGHSTGVGTAISQITANRSATLQNAFYATLQGHDKNSLAQLENLLACYRFFKECRNSLVHRGGEADQRTYDSYVAFAAVAIPGNLNLREVPKHSQPVVGKQVELSLRGVVGLGDVIIRLIATLDAELSICNQAEKEFLSRFRDWSTSAAGKARNILKRDPNARSKQIHGILRHLKFPIPVRVDEIEVLLLSEKILKVNYV